MSVPAPVRVSPFLASFGVLLLSSLSPPSAAAVAAVPDSQAVTTPAPQPSPTVISEDDRPGITVVSHGRQSRVRILGSIVVPPGERAGDVVAILGNVTVHGDVDGDVVAVGGDVELKENASVSGDVVAVGGKLVIAPTARLSGKSERVAVGFPAIQVMSPGEQDFSFQLLPDRSWLAGIAFTGTIVRLSAMLLLALVALVLFVGPVERVAWQVAASPVESLVVGLGVHLLAAPVILALSVGLLVTIIGIPLVPLLLLLVGGLFVIGFTGAAVALGRGVLRLTVVGQPGLLPAFVLGVLPMLALTLISRYAWWSGANWSGWVFALALTGLLCEGVLWTLGVGAGVLVWLRRYRNADLAPPVPPPAPPVPVQL